MFRPIVPPPIFVPVATAPQVHQTCATRHERFGTAASPNSEMGRREAANERANQGQGGREEELSDVMRRGPASGAFSGGKPSTSPFNDSFSL